MTRYDEKSGTDAGVRQSLHEPAGDCASEHDVRRALVSGMLADRQSRLRTAVEGTVGGGPDGRACFRASNLAGVREMVDSCRRLMFPGFFDVDAPWDGELDAYVTRLVARVGQLLEPELTSVTRYQRRPEHIPDAGVRRAFAGLDDAEFAQAVVRRFVSALPEIRRLLALDVQAAYDGDPAAEHTDEVILCYPGLEAIFCHRLAHELYRMGVPILPRVMAEDAHSRTGIDIHPGATIGERFFIDHGSGTVIGETSVIGRDVKIYQGVTLGARSFPKDEFGRAIRGIKRHPTIGDRVAIYAGAVILGGDTVIGEDCVIAGGVFVTGSVPAGHVVQQPRAELVLRPKGQAGGQGGGGKDEVRATAHSLDSRRERFTPVAASEAEWLDVGAGI
jgi:serine O-acetyltransferase